MESKKIGQLAAVAFLIGALALAGCGERSDSTAAQVAEPSSPSSLVPTPTYLSANFAQMGECFDGGDAETVEHVDLFSRLTDKTGTWVNVVDLARLGPAANPPADETAPAEAVVKQVLPNGEIAAEKLIGDLKLSAHSVFLDRLLEAQKQGMEVWLRLWTIDEGYYAADQIVFDSSQRFALVGYCDAPASASLSAGIERVLGSEINARELLLSVLAHVPSPEAKALAPGAPGGATWQDLPANRRSLNPEDAPPEVLRSLRFNEIDLPLTKELSSAQVVVCGLTSVGWGDCYPTASSGLSVRITVPFIPGVPTELWVMNSTGAMDSAVGPVGVVPPETNGRSAVVHSEAATRAASLSPDPGIVWTFES